MRDRLPLEGRRAGSLVRLFDALDHVLDQLGRHVPAELGLDAARMHGGRADAFARALELRPPSFHAGANFLREQHAEIAVCLRFAAIDVFGDAAGKSQLLQGAPLRQRIEPQ